MTDTAADAYWKDHEKRMTDARYEAVAEHAYEQPKITPPVTVQPWVVLYAIRYGMGRHSYADSDAARLVTEHAKVLAAKGWVETLSRDISERILAADTGPEARVKWTTALGALVQAQRDLDNELKATSDSG